MFGIGFQELLIIIVIALVVVGPERMPELARTVGRTIRDLRRMYDNLRGELGTDYEEVERAIRTLRALDPRRELDVYGRQLLNDLAQEVGPDAEELLQKSPAQISGQLTESLKQTISLNPNAVPATNGPAVPAVATSGLEAEVAAPETGATQGVREEVSDGQTASAPAAPETEPVRGRRARMYAVTREPVPPSPAPDGVVARRARTYTGKPEPARQPHLPDPRIARLSRDLLSDHLLDEPVREALGDVSSNGREPI